METVIKSERYKRIGQKLIENLPEFEFIRDMDIRIAYVASDRLKKKGNGFVLGECVLVKPIYQAFIPYDFIIVIYEMNTIELSINQLKLLIYHELRHIGVSDTTAEPEYKIVPHDVEDFRSILEEFGLDWAEEGKKIPDILRR